MQEVRRSFNLIPSWMIRAYCALDLLEDPGAEEGKEELEESFVNLNNCMEDLQAQGHIRWRMNASKAPHEAGVWERLVKTTKQTVLRVCRTSLLNYEEFLTILKETQALINDRPLVATSEDAIDVITPSMLTHGKKLKPFREFFEDSEIPRKNRR